MYTRILTKKGETIDLVTQQYQIGLYLIINGDPRLQGCLQQEENAYHIGIRKKNLKLGNTLVDGSIVNYTGKEPLNEFSVKEE